LRTTPSSASRPTTGTSVVVDRWRAGRARRGTRREGSGISPLACWYRDRPRVRKHLGPGFHTVRSRFTPPLLKEEPAMEGRRISGAIAIFLFMVWALPGASVQ